MSNTYKFHLHGMHCESCSVLIEDELKKVTGVERLHANFKTKELTVSGQFSDVDPLSLAALFTDKIKHHGYSVALERAGRSEVSFGEFKLAVPIAILFVAGFVLLQKMGIVNVVGGGEINLGTTFLVGVVASLSTCMAVVGGLLLSMSASYAKSGETIRPQIMFHIGRLVSFFVLGGVIGFLGSAFQISQSVYTAIGIVVALVMVILGLNLLDIFPFVERLQLTLPASLSKKIFHHAKAFDIFAPFLIGAATFFLPCGFTQSMQLYALTTGSYTSGALTMFIFAFGTLPILAMLSFSSVRINKSKYAGVFFKTVGLVVIAFGLYNLLNALVVLGLIAPIFSF